VNAAPRGDDAQMLVRLHAAFEDDASSSGRVDPDQVWASVRAQVPGRRRRRTVRRAVLAGGLAAVVVGGIGGTGWLRALDDRTSPPPATGVPTVLSADELLPAPLREPRSTSNEARAWVLPEQCAGTDPLPAGPVPAELVTARDGAGTYGSTIDVTQVARFGDPASAAAALQAQSRAVAQCAAGRTDLTLTPLGDGLTGVEVLEAGGSGGLGAARVSALVLAGDTVALLTTSGPLPATAAAREQVLDRAQAFTAAAISDRDTDDGGRP